MKLTLSTTDTTVSKGNIGTIGRFYFKNLDITNTIQISDDGSVYPLALKPGEDAKGRWNAAASMQSECRNTEILLPAY